MAIVNDDWSITRSTGNIRYIGDAHDGSTPSYATVIEFHRFLQELADDETFLNDDQLDIVDSTPSDRSTDNIISLINNFNIDQTSAEHLYDGSVSQNNGSDIWAGLIVVGSVTDGTVLQVVKNNEFESNAAAPYWGAAANGVALNGDVAGNIILRICVKIRSSGSDIDGKCLRVQARELGDTYAEFSLKAGLGNNTAAIFTAADLNNQLDVQAIISDVATYSIANDKEGYVGIDVTGDETDEFYYSKWTCGGITPLTALYEYTKYLQSRTVSQTADQLLFYGMNGMLFRGITHEINIDNVTGTFVEPEVVSWTGGTGQLLAINSVTAGTKMWIQLLTGVAPVDNDLITGNSTATATVNVDIVSRNVSVMWIGQSTGSAIIGGYGVGIDPSKLTSSDQLFDLKNELQEPPNNVQFTVSGLTIGEDRVFVGPADNSGNLKTDQFGLFAPLNSSTSSIVVTSLIPADTPPTGTIRVQLNSGVYQRLSYTSYSTQAFVIDSFDFSSDNADADNEVFITYIDKLATELSESFTSVFSSNRNLFIRVRDGASSPIKTFETTGTLTSGGGSSTAIRTSDA